MNEHVKEFVPEPHSKVAPPFVNMAERITRNPVSDFAGAYVIVLSDGTILDGMMIGGKDDVQMLGNITTRIREYIEKLEQTHQGAYGRR